MGLLAAAAIGKRNSPGGVSQFCSFSCELLHPGCVWVSASPDFGPQGVLERSVPLYGTPYLIADSTTDLIKSGQN